MLTITACVSEVQLFNCFFEVHVDNLVGSILVAFEVSMLYQGHAALTWCRYVGN